MFLRVHFFLLAAIYTSQCLAFINIESLRQNIEEGFNGSSGLSLSGASGNVDTFETGVNTQNIYRNKKREYIIIGSYKYGEASEVKNNHKGSFHLRYAQALSRPLFWEMFTQAEFNEFQSLTLRTLLGGGLRLALYRGEENSFFLGTGAFYEDEEIENGPDQANFRGNIYLSYRSLLSQVSEVVVVAYYQPSFKAINDYRIQATAGLESGLTEKLKIVNNFSFATDTKPPPGIKKEDFTYQVVFNLEY